MRSIILIKIFLVFCAGCTGGDQQILGSHGDFHHTQNLSSFTRIGFYSMDSFFLAFSRSSLFTKNLSKERARFFSFSSLVLSDHLENTLSDALNFKYKRVQGFRIEYRTPNPYRQSEQIKASGLVIMPSSDKPLPLLVYLHPTLLHKSEAPSLIPPTLFSIDPLEDQRLMIVSLALQGYIVFAPDYIGYGSSEDRIHPYLYKKSVVQTTGNLLRALEQVLQEDRVPFKREIFIMGYSQGGHGAMAFAEALQNSSMNFEIRALSAGGGPYDMLYTVREHLDKKSVWKLLLGLLLQSYSYIYNWNLDDILREKDYAGMIHELHKHDNSSRATEGLPNRTSSLFRSDFTQDILERDGMDYHKHLVENSVYDWRPNFPVLLFHAKKDQIVPYRNMEIAYRSLRRGRSRISKKDCSFKKVGDIVDVIETLEIRNIEPGHINCNLIFFLEASEYFSNQRR